MGSKREKTELERYVRGMMTQLRFQSLRRPDEWLRWLTPIPFGFLVGTGHLVSGIGLLVGVGAVEVGLTHRRLGGGTLSAKVARSLPEAAIRNAYRQLKRGTYDTKVGAEARAILESCAASANGIVAAAAEVHFANGGKPVVMESYRDISRSLDGMMKEALMRTERATIMDRRPDEATLVDLREIEANLGCLLGEARRLAVEFRAGRALPDDPLLIEERREARRELDQGA